MRKFKRRDAAINRRGRAMILTFVAIGISMTFAGGSLAEVIVITPVCPSHSSPGEGGRGCFCDEGYVEMESPGFGDCIAGFSERPPVTLDPWRPPGGGGGGGGQPPPEPDPEPEEDVCAWPGSESGNFSSCHEAFRSCEYDETRALQKCKNTDAAMHDLCGDEVWPGGEAQCQTIVLPGGVVHRTCAIPHGRGTIYVSGTPLDLARQCLDSWDRQGDYSIQARCEQRATDEADSCIDHVHEVCEECEEEYEEDPIWNVTIGPAEVTVLED